MREEEKQSKPLHDDKTLNRFVDDDDDDNDDAVFKPDPMASISICHAK